MSPFSLLCEPSSPLTQSIGLAAIGLIGLGRRRYRIATSLLVLSALWFGLCATPWFAHRLQHGLESSYPPHSAASYPTADAIVMLGGGALPSTDCESEGDLAKMLATRVGFGLALFRAGRADVMLISGDRHEAATMATMLLELGVPSNALVIDNSSLNTHENAEHSAALLNKAKLQDILLVTSPMHMPRAAATFRRQNIDVIPAPSIEPPTTQTAGSAWLPHRHAFYLSKRCLREYIGRWAYEMRGWA